MVTVIVLSDYFTWGTRSFKRQASQSASAPEVANSISFSSHQNSALWSRCVYQRDAWKRSRVKNSPSRHSYSAPYTNT